MDISFLPRFVFHYQAAILLDFLKKCRNIKKTKPKAMDERLQYTVYDNLWIPGIQFLLGKKIDEYVIAILKVCCSQPKLLKSRIQLYCHHTCIVGTQHNEKAWF